MNIYLERSRGSKPMYGRWRRLIKAAWMVLAVAIAIYLIMHIQ
jgi:hypothetical protein